jgi:hypothetical protein
MFKPLKVVPLVGKPGATLATLPSPSSAPASKTSIARQAAARAVNELFRFCELPSGGEPEAFLAAAIAIAAKFPVEVLRVAFDPVDGLPSRMRRPHLSDIRLACEKAYEPIQGALDRERTRALLAPPAPDSAEDKAKMKAWVDEFLIGRQGLAKYRTKTKAEADDEQRQSEKFLARCKTEAEGAARPAAAPSVFELDPADWNA